VVPRETVVELEELQQDRRGELSSAGTVGEQSGFRLEQRPLLNQLLFVPGSLQRVRAGLTQKTAILQGSAWAS
jgi:hypothetical protein